MTAVLVQRTRKLILRWPQVTAAVLKAALKPDHAQGLGQPVCEDSEVVALVTQMTRTKAILPDSYGQHKRLWGSRRVKTASQLPYFSRNPCSVQEESKSHTGPSPGLRQHAEIAWQCSTIISLLCSQFFKWSWISALSISPQMCTERPFLCTKQQKSGAFDPSVGI